LWRADGTLRGMGLLSRTRTSSRPMMRASAPKIALRPWARSHGLQFNGNELIAGAVPALPPDPDHRFNVVAGLPGGVRGGVAHVVERVTDNGVDQARPIFAWAPGTVVALPVPEAVGALLRFHAAAPDRVAENEWARRVDLGATGFAASAAPATDPQVLRALLDAGVDGALTGEPGARGVHFAFGCLWVECAGYLDAGAIEAVANRAARMADALREASLRALPAAPFDAPLPPPTWLDRAAPGGTAVFTGREGEGLDAPVFTPALAAFVREVPGKRGLIAEDALAFHRAFPHAPLRGQAIAVFRGTFGSGRPGRVVATNELPLPDRIGSDVALVAVDAPDGPVQGAPDGVLASVAGGLLSVRRLGGRALSAPSLLELGGIAAGLAEQRGW
jgi:hypothetical protein